MHRFKKLSARLLSFALTVAMIMSMMPITVLAAEGQAARLLENGAVVSFDKLEDRFIPSTGKDAPKHIYVLSVPHGTTAEALSLPTKLSATVQRISVVNADPEGQATATAGAPPQMQTILANEKIDITWKSDKTFTGDENAKFVYTAVLPEGFMLADGVQLPQIYVAVGRQARAAGDTEITVGGADATADYTEATSTNLNKAFTDIANSGTITVGDNITFDMQVTVPAGKTVTLNLNGKTLTVTGNRLINGMIVNGALIITDTSYGRISTMSEQGSVSGKIINVASTGSVTVNNGTIATEYSPVVPIYTAGDVTIAGGTVSSTAFDGGCAIEAIGSANITVSGGTVSVADTFSGGIAIDTSSTGNLTISGGTVSSAVGRAIYSQSTGPVTVSGTAKVTSDRPDDKSGGTITFTSRIDPAAIMMKIEGGTVENTVNGKSVCFTDSVITADNLSSYYSKTGGTVGRVSPEPAAQAEIVVGGETPTASYEAATRENLQKAFTEIPNNGIIKLGADIALDETGVSAPAGKKYTLDLNGKTLTVTDAAIEINGALIIDDTATAGGGKILTRTEYQNLIELMDTASIVVNNGTLSTTDGINIYNNGTGSVTVQGGTLTTIDGVAICNEEISNVAITGGTVSATGNGIAILNVLGGNITVENATVSALEGVAIQNSGDGSVVVKSGTVSSTLGAAIAADNVDKTCNITVSGGTVSTTRNTAIGNSSKGNITVTGGTISATTGIAIRIGFGIVTVSGADTKITSANTDAEGGGTIFAPKYRKGLPHPAQVTVDIQGGTVENTAKPRGWSVYVERDGLTYETLSTYYQKANGATVGKVYPNQVITIGGDTPTEGYESADANNLQKAFNSIAIDGTIKLGDNITASSPITAPVGNSYMLELNGKTLAMNNGSLNVNGELIIADATNNGTITGGTGVTTIKVADTGSLGVAGGKVMATGASPAINNLGTGNVAVSGGKVSGDTGSAITNASTGKITISGASTQITSAATAASGGTIYLLGNVPSIATTLLDIQGGTVENTATDGGYAVYFNDSTLTYTTAKGYYIIAQNATVGAVYPSLLAITIGGITPTTGYETADSATMLKAFADISTNGVIKMGKQLNELSDNITVPKGKKVTLDLNDKMVTASNQIQVNGDFIVTDKSATKTGILKSTSLTADFITVGDAKSAGNFTVSAGTVTGNDITGNAAIVKNVGTGTITVSGGMVSGTVGDTIHNTNAGSVIVSGGKVTTTSNTAIQNDSFGAVTVSSGKVSATTGVAIANEDYGVITISGATTIVTSTNVTATKGTILMNGLPLLPTTILDIQSGTVSNTAVAQGYSVYFSNESVTADNIGDYYTAATGATVGKVFPAAATLATITVGGATGATEGYETASRETLQKAFTNISDEGTIKLGANITMDLTVMIAPADKKYTLDLNGKTITITDNDAPLKVCGTLTIIDSSTGGKMTTTNMNDNAIYVPAEGSLIVKGGTITTPHEYASGILTDGNVTIDGGTVSATGRDNNAIMSGAAANVTIKSGTVSATGDKAHAIYHNSTGALNINGGTVSATGNNFGIRNEKAGAINITAGTVSSVEQYAIYNYNVGLVTISGTAKVTSAVAATAGNGTIGVGGALLEPGILLDIQGGTVENTASPEGYSVYGTHSGITIDNLSDYYTQAAGATVGFVYPNRRAITIGGPDATEGYGNMDSDTLAKAFATIGNDGVIKMGTDFTTLNADLNVRKGKKITLDLNGKNIKIPAVSGEAKAAQIKVLGDLTVTDTSELKSGTLKTENLGAEFISVGNATTAGNLTIEAGTISGQDANNSSPIIKNVGTGNITVSGGKVSATMGAAITNEKDGVITISGATTVVTSANATATEGTILMKGVPSAAKIMLKIQSGTVSNTATPEGCSVNFSNASVTGDNLYSYYSVMATGSTGATVGTVKPTPLSAITVGGVDATPGYQEASAATLNKAFTFIGHKGTIKIGASFTFSTTVTAPAGKEVTLDLAGNSLTTGSENALLAVNGALIIDNSLSTGGNISGTTESQPIITVASGGELTVKKGNVTASAASAVAIKNEGNVTVKGGVVSATGTDGVAITLKDSAKATIEGGTVQGTTSADCAIKNGGEGMVKVTGGTVSGLLGIEAIVNTNRGTIWVTGGTVSAVSASAIQDEFAGIVVIEGTATVTSATASTGTLGTITIKMKPYNAKVVLNIKGGTVSNTATTEGYSVYFLEPSITPKNLSSYYTQATSATVGKVFPAAPSEIIVGGTGATTGYETANAATLQKAFDDIANEGKIKLNADISTSTATITAPADKKYTLDLNGKTLSIVDEQIKVSGTLTISDSATGGKIALSATGTSVCAIEVLAKGGVILTGGTVFSPTSGGMAIKNAGDVTVSGGTVAATSTESGAMAIMNNGAANLTITSGTVSADNNGGSAIYHGSTGNVTISGGTVSAAKTNLAITNVSTGNVTVSGGKVSAATASAILNNSTGVITISGATTIVTSANVTATEGTIHIKGLPTTASIILNIQSGTVSNTATPNAGYSVYFSNASVTADNVSDYLNKAKSATVGKIFPEPAAVLSEIIIGGTTGATVGYETADADTLQKAFKKIADEGTIKLNADISTGTATIITPAIKKYTLDLNGKTLDVASNEIEVNGSLTITDTTTAKDGKINTNVKKRGLFNATETGNITVAAGSLNTKRGTPISNYGTGTITIAGGTVERTDAFDSDEVYVIFNSGTGNIIVSGGAVKGGAATTIYNKSTGNVTVSGGTVSANFGTAIYNYTTGNVTVSGGTVSSATGVAINNIRTGVVTIKGATTVVTSATTDDTDGTIRSSGFPETAKILVDIQGGTVSNTASPENWSVYYSNAQFTEDNVDSYYSAASGATVGKVFPKSSVVTSITIGGATGATEGYETANRETLQKAFTNISDEGTIKLGADIRLDDTGVIAPADKKYTLNLNGKTLTITDAAIDVNGTLTIDDTATAGGGKILTLTEYQDLLVLIDKASIVLKKGALSTPSGSTIYNIGTGSITVQGGTLTTVDGVAIYSDCTSSDDGKSDVAITGGTVSATGSGTAIWNGSGGNITVEKATVSALEGGTIQNSGDGSIVVKSGTVSATGGFAILADTITTTCNITVSGGTVSTTTGTAISNASKGNITVTDGTVSATTGVAINNESTGLVEISGATTVVTSANVTAAEGTIHMKGLPTTAKKILNIKSGTVSNTATTEGYSVYFSNVGVTQDNISSYYSVTTGTTGATVGKVFPVNCITVGGSRPTSGYETADRITLQSAFDAILDGGIVKLGDGMTLGDPSIATPTDKKCTLDLNGQTIMVTTVPIGVYGKLTITDTSSGGKISTAASNTEPGIISILDKGDLTIAGGTVSAPNAGASAISNRGKLTVTGGTVSASGTNGIGIYTRSDSDVTISGGTVSATGTSIAIENRSAGKINIEGGTVSATDNSAISNIYNGVITISGAKTVVTSAVAASATKGTILLKGIPATASVLLNIKSGTVSNTATTEGYSVYFSNVGVTSDNRSSYYSVTTGAAGATVGKVFPAAAALTAITIGGANATEGYKTADSATLVKAFADVATNGTIKLGDNVASLSTSITVPKDKKITLDLNGKNITVPNVAGMGASAQIIVMGDFIVKDTSTLKNGVLKTEDLSAEFISVGDTTNAGNFTILGGTITGSDDMALAAIVKNIGAGTITVTGGTLTSTANGTIINNKSTGKILVDGGTVSTTTDAVAINNSSTGEVAISGGTVSTTRKEAINNTSTGAITITGGKVSSTTARAIASSNDGVITISGATTIVTSANVTATEGTIHIKGFPTVAKIMLNIKSGTVSNTASTEGYSVYFSNVGVTADNRSSYYSVTTGATGATVGKVFPVVLADYKGTEATAPSTTATKTATSITLTAVTVTGETIEYAKSTSNTAPTTGWQESTAFTDLTANTQYYFFARVKESATHKAGTTSTGTAITTNAATLPEYKGIEATAPSSTATKTATSITLTAVTVTDETIEYAKSTSNTAPTTGWQESTAFTGLTANTQYYFFARVKESATHKAGTTSTGTAITTNAATLPDYKGIEATAPSTTATKTATSITLTAVTVTGETIEYAKSTSNTAPTTGWQESTAFTDLTANTQYYFFARVKESATHKAGTTSTGTAISTDKSAYTGIEAAAPSSTPVSKTNTAITLAAVTVAGETIEYAKSTSNTAPTLDADWQTNTAFTELAAGTQYYFFARVKANTTHNAGAASAGAAITTTGTALPDYSGTEAAAPSGTPASKTDTTVTLAAVTVTGESIEYAKSTTNTAPTSESNWQDGTEFTGLSANTQYYFFARVKASATHKVGAISTGTAITTDKSNYTGTEAAAPSGTPASKTDTTVTLAAVTVTGESIEYAKSTSNTAPTSESNWQDGTEFTGLSANTQYYFFARVKASATHKVGAISTGTAITTDKSNYTGTEPAAPSGTPASKTDTTVNLAAVTVTGESIEYAKSTTNTAPTADSDWQTGTEFTGLSANTQYYFFARVKASETHKAGTTSAGTAITTDKSAAQKLDAAKELADTAIANFVASNTTVASDLITTVNSAIATINGVTATWKLGSPIITAATNSAPGSITGTMVLTCGSDTVEITVNKTIAQLTADAEKAANAKVAVLAALNSFIATNYTTDADVLAFIDKALTDAGITGVKSAWSEAFSKTLATISATGTITGEIELKCGEASEKIDISFVIAKLANKTQLNDVINAVNTAKIGIGVNDHSPAQVLKGKKYVSAENMRKFNEKLASAKAVADNTQATQAQIDAAMQALNSALADFNANIKIGTNEPKGDKEVVVKPGAPVSKVEGIDELFTPENIVTDNTKGVTAEDNKVLENGGSVKVAVTIEPKAKLEIVKDAALLNIFAPNRLFSFLNISVIKQVTPLDGTTTTTNLASLPKLLAIRMEIPADLRDKKDLSIYRVHNGVAQNLPLSDGTKEGYTISGIYVTVYTMNFSTYAIGYTEQTPAKPDSKPDTKPSTPDNTPAKANPQTGVKIAK